MTRKYGARPPLEEPQHRLLVQEHEILTRAPMKQASLQMRPGEPGYDFVPARHRFWEVPPPLVRPWRGCPDLSGQRFGRMTVVGLIDLHYVEIGGDVKHKCWLVRCACGLYEHRRTAAVKRAVALGSDNDARCHRCSYQRNQSHRYAYDKTKRWPSGSREKPAAGQPARAQKLGAALSRMMSGARS